MYMEINGGGTYEDLELIGTYGSLQCRDIDMVFILPANVPFYSSPYMAVPNL